MTETATDQTPPRFKVSGLATLKHLNVRKENHGEDKVLAVDLKLEFQSVPRELCEFFDPALLEFLWRADEDKMLTVRNLFVSPVAYVFDIENCALKIHEATYHGCTAKKFLLEPLDGGGLRLGCNVILHPHSGQVSEVDDLAWMVQEDQRVTIEGPPSLFAEN